MHDLRATARAMVTPGKGILAADESSPTITKRFERLGIESTAETRGAYREMLFTTPGLAEHTSGVILYDETFRQAASDGRPFPAPLPTSASCPASRSTPAPSPTPATPARR